MATRVPVKASSRKKKTSRSPRGSILRRILWWAGAAFVIFYGLILVSLAGLRFIDPPTTSVQMQRRVESWFSSGHYEKHYVFVPLQQISPAFQHAVIAAEDGRFYQHHGFDWSQIEIAATQDLEKGRKRGASTITQQLVKNLFLTTSRTLVRKGLEFSIVPLAELLLGKQRILELYLNVVEWGPGIYGAEAAAEYYYHKPATHIDREQGARLAAILPAPRRRKPAAMTQYANRILDRMRQMNW